MQSYLNSIEKKLIEFRRELHRYPELGFKEYETTNRIASLLESEGLQVTRFKETTGLMVEISGKSGRTGPLVLVRADIDGLPIKDLKSCDYKSRNEGVMHACGHDVHTTVVVGLLLALNKLKSDLDFNVRVVFQPAEELGKGAESLIGQGILENVNYALSLHVDTIVPLGKVAIRAGSINAAVIDFDVVLKGKTAHVARVHEGIDTIGPACQFINWCYSHIPKKIDAREPNLLYFGVFKSGTASNVVSPECYLSATIRAFSTNTAVMVFKEAKKIAQGISESTGVIFEFTELTNLRAVVNDKYVVGLLSQAAMDIVGLDNIISDLPTSMGGEDFGVVISNVPGAMMRLGVAPESGQAPGLHTGTFDIPESAILPRGENFG